MTMCTKLNFWNFCQGLFASLQRIISMYIADVLAATHHSAVKKVGAVDTTMMRTLVQCLASPVPRQRHVSAIILVRCWQLHCGT